MERDGAEGDGCAGDAYAAEASFGFAEWGGVSVFVGRVLEGETCGTCVWACACGVWAGECVLG